MRAGGFYLMQRGWMDDDVFPSPRREPFCHRAAWCWLIEHAAHAAHSVRIRGRTVNLERGQLAASLLHLVGAWGWDTMKVARFLSVISERGMIERATVKVGTVITICNYEKYQAEAKSTVIVSDARPRLSVSGDRYGREQGRTIKQKKDSRSAPRGATVTDMDFEVWWRECPRKIAKGAGLRAYRTARKSAEVAELLDGIKRYAATRAGEDNQYTAHPATWLNGKRWLDQTGGNDGERQTGPTGPPPPFVRRAD